MKIPRSSPGDEMSFSDEKLQQKRELLRLGVDPMSSIDDERALLSRLDAAENCFDSLTHESDCILSLWEAGEPTPDGGYRMKYAGTRYQTRPIDETPKCTCGLDEKFEEWKKAAGK